MNPETTITTSDNLCYGLNRGDIITINGVNHIITELTPQAFKCRKVRWFDEFFWFTKRCLKGIISSIRSINT